MTNERLNDVYDKTDGYCHLCHGKLAYRNYGMHGAKGCWHVEHSVPKAKGGTDHLNNLFPACISCNLIKGTNPTKKANGVTRAPYSKHKKEKIRNDNVIGSATAGFFIGGLFWNADFGCYNWWLGCVKKYTQLITLTLNSCMD